MTVTYNNWKAVDALLYHNACAKEVRVSCATLDSGLRVINETSTRNELHKSQRQIYFTRWNRCAENPGSPNSSHLVDIVFTSVGIYLIVPELSLLLKTSWNFIGHDLSNKTFKPFSFFVSFFIITMNSGIFIQRLDLHSREKREVTFFFFKRIGDLVWEFCFIYKASRFSSVN